MTVRNPLAGAKALALSVACQFTAVLTPDAALASPRFLQVHEVVMGADTSRKSSNQACPCGRRICHAGLHSLPVGDKYPQAALVFSTAKHLADHCYDAKRGSMGSNRPIGLSSRVRTMPRMWIIEPATGDA